LLAVSVARKYPWGAPEKVLSTQTKIEDFCKVFHDSTTML
jgi:hypothetical protein